MPRRKTTRAQDRASRIQRERDLNVGYLRLNDGCVS